jgi:hypothetical protein
MLLLSDEDRKEALALPGASLFDPMGDGRVRSDKVMLPESMMREPQKLRAWIARAFDAAPRLPKKAAKKVAAKRAPARKNAPTKKTARRR